ncbi:HTH-type transcriptional regulator TfdT [Trichinella spiralis]|uniref:HTH-type transcriptional regulator TfdT n=1 Tax=Trichinella spiralis TaxID=6334 RepID=A0ABR3KWM1_TRISP
MWRKQRSSWKKFAGSLIKQSDRASLANQRSTFPMMKCLFVFERILVIKHYPIPVDVLHLTKTVDKEKLLTGFLDLKTCTMLD